jgi:hypothetical protein
VATATPPDPSFLACNWRSVWVSSRRQLLGVNPIRCTHWDILDNRTAKPISGRILLGDFGLEGSAIGDRSAQDPSCKEINSHQSHLNHRACFGEGEEGAKFSPSCLQLDEAVLRRTMPTSWNSKVMPKARIAHYDSFCPFQENQITESGNAHEV